jgi:hypothetical protein
VTPERPNDLVLTTEQNWAARSHRELYDAVHQNNDPGKSGEIGWQWERFGSGLSESAAFIDKELAATESGWTGTAAEAARAAIRSLAQWVTETAGHTTELGARVQEQSRIMETARAAMPEPVEFDWDAATGTLSGPGIASFAASAADVQAANEKARAAHEQAVAVMTEMERQSRGVDAHTPHFTAPFNPTTGRVEEPPQPATVTEESGSRDTAESATEKTEFATRSARPEDLPSDVDTTRQMLTASSGVPGGQLSLVPEQTHPTAQQPTGQSGTAAAAAAAAGAGAGLGAYAARGVGRPPSDDYDKQIRTGGLPSTPSMGAAAGQQSPEQVTQRPQPVSQPPGVPQQSFGGSGGGVPLGPAAGGGGAGGFGGPRGRAKGKQQEDIELSPGRATAATNVTEGPAPTTPNASGVVGAHNPAEGGGAMPPGGGAPRSQGAEDTERKTAYVQSEDLFDVPGDELPPSVIGGRKKGTS